jgi:hypothetical protein
MKFEFIKNILSTLFVFSGSLFYLSCSENDIVATPVTGLIKISEGYAIGAATKVEIWANEELFAGYNAVQLALYDSLTGKTLTEAHIEINPIMQMENMSHSCPVEQPGQYAVNKLFPAAILFTMPSGDMGNWSMEIRITNHITEYFGKALLAIHVKSTAPSKVISFQTASGARYYLSYQFPGQPKVGMNVFEVIVYTLKDEKFIPAEDLAIHITPEMPSMDHGSPNNEDPVHTANGHYEGKVNFTMTGEWRLHLELRDGSSVIGAKYFDTVID